MIDGQIAGTMINDQIVATRVRHRTLLHWSEAPNYRGTMIDDQIVATVSHRTLLHRSADIAQCSPGQVLKSE